MFLRSQRNLPVSSRSDRSQFLCLSGASELEEWLYRSLCWISQQPEGRDWLMNIFFAFRDFNFCVLISEKCSCIDFKKTLSLSQSCCDTLHRLRYDKHCPSSREDSAGTWKTWNRWTVTAKALEKTPLVPEKHEIGGRSLLELSVRLRWVHRYLASVNDDSRSFE